MRNVFRFQGVGHSRSRGRGICQCHSLRDFFFQANLGLLSQRVCHGNQSQRLSLSFFTSKISFLSLSFLFHELSSFPFMENKCLRKKRESCEMEMVQLLIIDHYLVVLLNIISLDKFKQQKDTCFNLMFQISQIIKTMYHLGN